ncbi:MAG TPA: acyclic terpene utilization AtuA family protein [Acidimicrobiales bacterium]|nr:acyclic terpene utilization AtuA family protein [Acidimicrobiales bacterium]
MSTPDVLRIANCSGFFGDRLAAPREMVDGGPVDVLTGDYLAELTMLILLKSRQRDPSLGYASTFYRQMEDVLGTCCDRGIKVVANAGGLNPAGLAARLRALADELGIDASIAHVEGDDILGQLPDLQAAGNALAHLDTGMALASASDPVSANAYLGGFAVAEALASGADVVVTGRVTDASLVVGPAAWHFGWQRDDWDRLAGAVAVGHVIECGAQATGGNYAFFAEVPGLEHPGFPIAEVASDGSAVITKHPGTGGLVSVGTVTAQLLYEIAGPLYANADVVADFSTIRLEQQGPDRVRMWGVRGLPAPEQLKVSINLLGGWRNAMTFILTGLDIEAKAALAERTLWQSLGGTEAFADHDVRLIRTDHPDAATNEQASAQLRITVKSPDPDAVGRRFSNAATEMALASYPGFYLTSPPGAAVAYGVYWPTLVPRHTVPEIAVHHDGRRVTMAPPPLTSPSTAAPESAPTTPALESPVPGFPPVESRPTASATVASSESRSSENGSSENGSSENGHQNGHSRRGSATRRLPLGSIIGARSGDKGGNANVGLWARDEAAFAWLRKALTVEQLRLLLPEAATLDIDRYELPNLLAVNFVVHDLLGEGVASSTRPDAQAKSLGEYLRSRLVDIPGDIVDATPPPPAGH